MPQCLVLHTLTYLFKSTLHAIYPAHHVIVDGAD